MIVVYEQFGIAINMGIGNWTTIRKVNTVVSAEDPTPKEFCLAIDFNQPGHAIPYPSEADRDAHWNTLVSILRQQNSGIVGATKIPPNIFNPGVERR